MPEIPVPSKSWVSRLTSFRLDVLNLALLLTEKALDSVQGIRLPRVSSVRTVLYNTDSSGHLDKQISNQDSDPLQRPSNRRALRVPAYHFPPITHVTLCEVRFVRYIVEKHQND